MVEISITQTDFIIAQQRQEILELRKELALAKRISKNWMVSCWMASGRYHDLDNTDESKNFFGEVMAYCDFKIGGMIEFRITGASRTAYCDNKSLWLFYRSSIVDSFDWGSKIDISCILRGDKLILIDPIPY